MQQHQARRDVRPVRVADRDEIGEIQAIFFRCGLDEVCQLVGAEDEVFVVEDALCEAPEEARCAVLGDLAPGAQDRCAGRQLLPERNEVVLASSGPVQHQ